MTFTNQSTSRTLIAIASFLAVSAGLSIVIRMNEGVEKSGSIRRRQLLSLRKFFDPATVVTKKERCTYVNNLGVEVSAQPSIEPATYIEQVASNDLLEQLHLDVNTQRPIWTSGVVAELDKIVASGGSISCPHYPHSAEDVAMAVKKVGMNLKNAKVGVISSISPWVEHVLRSQGASRVITVDYNHPIVCSGIDWVESKSVAEFGAEDGAYDMLVSFSGIEHSGLGRYGDPINPDGDIEAMADMHRALAPGGYLLLAIPTYASYQVQGIQHRIYGPERLALMIENFDFMGRVWDGHVFGGWDDIDALPKLFSVTQEIEPFVLAWQFQNVLILRKPDH